MRLRALIGQRASRAIGKEFRRDDPGEGKIQAKGQEIKIKKGNNEKLR